MIKATPMSLKPSPISGSFPHRDCPCRLPSCSCCEECRMRTCSFPGAAETICRREPEPMMNPSSTGCAHATPDARSIGNPYVLGTCCRRFTAISGSAGPPAADHRFDDHPLVYAYGQHGRSLPSVQSRQQGLHAFLAFHRLFHRRNINIFIAFAAYWSW